MYPLVLLLHSYLRWLLVLVAAASLIRSLAGWWGKKDWQPWDERLHVAFVAAMDAQLLFGLVLYFALSPLSSAFLYDVGGAIKDPVLRFYGLEHGLVMFVAVAVAHGVRVRSKRTVEPARRHRTVAIGHLVWFVLVAAAFPWPGQPYGRPWFR